MWKEFDDIVSAEKRTPYRENHPWMSDNKFSVDEDYVMESRSTAAKRSSIVEANILWREEFPRRWPQGLHLLRYLKVLCRSLFQRRRRVGVNFGIQYHISLSFCCVPPTSIC